MKVKIAPTKVLVVLFVLLLAASSLQGQSGTIQFKSLAYGVYESGPTAKVAVTRSGGTAGTVSATFATINGTALSGTDYAATNGTLTFGPGVSTLYFYVPVVNDLEHESPETVTVELTGEAVGLLNNATLTITDNDACVFAVAPNKMTHGAEGGLGNIAVTATAGCAWTAVESPDVDWIAIISGATATGSGEVQYSCDPYLGIAPRNATLAVAGKTFTVTQQGVFVPLTGSYNGIFREEVITNHQSLGFLSLKLTDLGAFTARLNLAGKRHSISGRFAPDGRATNSVLRAGAEELTVTLVADLEEDSDQITGEITDGNWTSLLVADRAVYHKTSNPAPQAGRYTLIVRGDVENSAQEPGGDSFGTVTVDAGGNVKLGATLADGTKVSQKVPLSKNGEWPLYLPLYRNGGFVLSSIAFTDEPESDFAGMFVWIKPAMATTRFYAAGFGQVQPLVGARYRAPTNTADRVLSFSSGTVAFSAGNLAEDFENGVTLSEASKVVNLENNKLTLRITLPTGLFSGTVVAPGTTRSIPFKGALHQKGTNYGAGFFLGTDQSGRVLFSE